VNFADFNLGNLLPHGDAMCLVDEVLSHDDHGMECRTNQHHNVECVLRCDGHMSIYAAIEMAAQAAALHAARLVVNGTHEKVAPMVLGAIRGLEYPRGDLNLCDYPGSIVIDVHLQQGNDSIAIYAFSLTVDGDALASGRMTLLRTNIAPLIDAL
jgi:predicted hotdog family 3-hydroxylacyl-ACP dehydratase